MDPPSHLSWLLSSIRSNQLEYWVRFNVVPENVCWGTHPNSLRETFGVMPHFS